MSLKKGEAVTVNVSAGPEVFASSIVEQCVRVLKEEYLLPKADKDQLFLRMTKATAGLDAFLPL